MGARMVGCGEATPEWRVSTSRRLWSGGTEVFRLGARSLGGKVQWLAFVGLEVMGHGGVREMVAERFGADKA